MGTEYNHHGPRSSAPPPPLQDPAQQRRAFPIQPPTLSTAVTLGHLHPQTPASALSGRSPFSASVTSPMTTVTPRGSSPMAPRNVTPYNPQDWTRNGPVGGSYRPHATPVTRAQQSRDATGYEANLPSPPPPYTATPSSPSPHTTTFQSLNASPAIGTDGSPSIASRQFSSPQQGYSTSGEGAFPPPPPLGRDRSSSRSRFNLSMLSSRNRQSSNNAMETLQNQTMEALARAPAPPGQGSGLVWDTAPPNARRAASAGAITHNSFEEYRHSPEGESSNRNTQARQSGFALPPPPPGPPPTSRSQSLSRTLGKASNGQQRTDAGGSSFGAAAPHRATAAAVSRLGPIPPTPADWVDETVKQTTSRQGSAARQNPAPSPAPQSSANRQASRPPSRLDENSTVNEQNHLSTNDMNQRVLQRSETTTIRERRTASKARSAVKEPQSAVESQRAPWSGEQDSAKPANLVLQSSDGALNRRRRVSKAKTSPLWNKSPQSGSAPNSGRNIDSATLNGDSTTPSSAQKLGAVDTPPFSSDSEHGQQLPKVDIVSGARSYAFPPTPREKPNGFVSNRSSTSDKPNDVASPLLSNSLPSFISEARERHRLFLEKEAAASTDVEKLELFAEFIVHESRLRRDCYSEAFDSLGSDVLDLTRDMWRSYNVPKRNKTPVAPSELDRKTPVARVITDSPEPDDTPLSATTSQSISYTPKTDAGSPSSPHPARKDLQRQNSYQPMLSPIPSMAMSTVPDDEDSRGRPSSRWWEASESQPSIGAARKVERSKRESKYMGVPKEIRENPQWEGVQQSPMHSSPGPSQLYYNLTPNEYPPEKVGWHDQDEYYNAEAMIPPPPPPPPGPPPSQRTPLGPRMDLSRLITLPPPYPRHHPALNNNHPELANIRATLRTVNHQGESEEARDKHVELMEAASPQFESQAIIAERRKQLHVEIQQKVNDGRMSFAEAATAEADFDKNETSRSRAAAQKEFDTFQSQVVGPINRAFQDKVNKASGAIDLLKGSLADDERSHDPNRAQEEGDEKPELLEKITLLKWFFEARESLYREMFDLEGESDERYKQVILTPYRIAGNQEKIHEVESFFSKDTMDRRVKFEQKVLKRFEDFLRTVEKSVTRGAELQLSAFWDIAPALLEVVQKVPNNLDSFEIFIPGQEYDENPSYHDFPMQYLFTLLLHARRSAYQFIESQTNLLCLLHEVKTGVMTSGCRLLEVQRRQAGEDKEAAKKEMFAIKKDEDARLTSDLKERVQLVEEQWRQALGKGLEDCENRVERFLTDQNGWDDSLKE